ncbi:MAG: response regulator transcription factor, partial [Candidatus Sericytochromatia bacterium]|nr:response regulator transcription factor [Candidatus Tanganyikabacteria bacterium]
HQATSSGTACNLQFNRSTGGRFRQATASTLGVTPKPFSLRELVARIKALLRRSKPAEADKAVKVYQHGDLLINLSEHRVMVGEREVELSPKEFKILAMLMGQPGRVFSREELLEQVWGLDFYGDTKTVDVHIRWLREKIEEDPSNPKYIQTVRGFGYRLGT